jgi:hypothetical protein
MHKRHLPIANPCFENWDAMSDHGGGRRFCNNCSEFVHDLSELTESQARRLLERREGEDSVCIRYSSCADTGELLFRCPSVRAPAPPKFAGWRGVAAGFASVVMSACVDPSPEPTELDARHCTYERGLIEFKLARGEGSCPPVEREKPVVAQETLADAPPQLEVVDEQAPGEPCEPEATEVVDESRNRLPVKGKKIRKRQGKPKKITLADDADMGLY